MSQTTFTIFVVIVTTIAFILGLHLNKHNSTPDADVDTLIKRLSKYSIISTQTNDDGDIVKLVLFFDEDVFNNEVGSTMRDPERIDKFCEKLKSEWKRYPDFRFWQMIMNVASEFDVDPFYVEDDKGEEVFTKFFDKFLNESSKDREDDV